MGSVLITTWIGNAAAVLCGPWGAVSWHAHEIACSRQAMYKQAQRIAQAVARAQAGGPSYEALEAENQCLRAENAALWETLEEIEDLSVAKQQECAATGAAMGLGLNQMVTLLAIVLPRGRVPSRAKVGRWVAQASSRAGGMLAVRDHVRQAVVLTSVPIDKTARPRARPPHTVRRPRQVPLARLSGATPTRAAICWRLRVPNAGRAKQRVRAHTSPRPGALCNRSSSARQSGLAPRGPQEAVGLGRPPRAPWLAAPQEGAPLLRLGSGQRPGRGPDRVDTVRQGAGLQRWERNQRNAWVARPCRYGLSGTRQRCGLWEYRT